MRTGTITLAISLSLIWLAPAAAGGGNWIEFEDAYNVPGSEITIEAVFSTRNEGRTRARAPYYVYLQLVKGPEYGWELPEVDAPNVYRVGTVEILWPEDGHEFTDGLSMNPHLRSTFTLPELPVGRYLMSICDATCSDTPGGRWGGVDTTGFFHVVGTAGEAEARQRLLDVRERFSVYRYRDQRNDEKASREFAADLKAQARREGRLVADLDAARRNVTRLEGHLNDARRDRNVALAAVAALLAIGLAIVIRGALRSRRRARARVPRGSRGPGSGSHVPNAASGSPSISRRWISTSPRATRHRDREPTRPGSSPRTSEPRWERSEASPDPGDRLP